MKPRNREINIFNLSMMDVICGALGAFLILFLLLQPYYGKTAQAPPAAPPKNVREAARQIQDLREQVEKLERDLQEHNAIQFVLDTHWAGVDLDLWVYQQSDGSWNGPNGKKLFDSVLPKFTFTDALANDTRSSEAFRVITHPEDNYVVVVHWHSGRPKENVRLPMDVAFGITRNYPKSSAHAQVFPVPLSGPGVAQIVGVVRVTPEAFQVQRFNEPWQGGAFPAPVSEALRKFSTTP